MTFIENPHIIRGIIDIKKPTMSESYVSKEKLEELKAELKELKTTKRFEIAERLKKAKEFGDLSENFEYAHAKEDQEKLEREIFKLENLIKNAHVITRSRSKEEVSVGLEVVVKSEDGQEMHLTIVGSQEANPAQNKVSNTSPIGKALIGKKVGDTAIVLTPKGREVAYKIIRIE